MHSSSYCGVTHRDNGLRVDETVSFVCVRENNQNGPSAQYPIKGKTRRLRANVSWFSVDTQTTQSRRALLSWPCHRDCITFCMRKRASGNKNVRCHAIENVYLSGYNTYIYIYFTLSVTELFIEVQLSCRNPSKYRARGLRYDPTYLTGGEFVLHSIKTYYS